MSKKKSKKASKKSESDVGSTPTKSAIQTVYESFLNTESLTLSQQKNIVSALYLSNYSLYDSMIIEIITDFLQFAKSIQLNSNQIHSIYHTLQSLLHKIKNNADYSLDEATHYLNERISSQIEKEIENASDESEYISTQQSQSITEFIQQRIFSQYALYRVALFEQNPSNIRYKKFKKSFEIGDIVRFQNEECLFKIEQFRSNDIALSCLHDDFKSFEVNEKDKTDQDDAGEIKQYIVSRDQLTFLDFVSKPKSEADATEITEHENVNINEEEEEENGVNNDENQEPSNQTQTEKHADQEQKPIVTEDALNKDDVKIGQMENEPTTLIDLILNKKMEQKLKSMQQKFDKELQQYKQQIENLQNISR
eukprot:362692_1